MNTSLNWFRRAKPGLFGLAFCALFFGAARIGNPVLSVIFSGAVGTIMVAAYCFLMSNDLRSTKILCFSCGFVFFFVTSGCIIALWQESPAKDPIWALMICVILAAAGCGVAELVKVEERRWLLSDRMKEQRKEA
jgi:hypothetical protein